VANSFVAGLNKLELRATAYSSADTACCASTGFRVVDAGQAKALGLKRPEVFHGHFAFLRHAQR